MNTYQKTIANILEMQGRKDIDPRHIEAYMRLQYSTLDHLSYSDFFKECKICTECIDYDGKENTEKLAKSYAL